jgi:hypothetical protein
MFESQESEKFTDNTSTALTDIKKNELRVFQTVETVIGTAELPKPIQDDQTMDQVIELRNEVDDLLKAIEGHWKPIKAELRAPWQVAVDEEKKMLEVVKGKQDLILKAIRKYNDQRAEEERIKREAAAKIERERLQAIADKEAEERREAFKKQAEEALKSNNLDAALELEEAAKGVGAEIVETPTIEPVKQMFKGSSGTQSQVDIIEDFKITDNLEFVKGLIEMGVGYMIQVDAKTLTALNKHLIANPGIKSVKGYQFRRGLKDTFRKRGGKFED